MSLVDDWDDEASDDGHEEFVSSNSGGDGRGAASAASGGYVDISREARVDPIFSLEQVQYTPSGLLHLKVSNKALVMAQANMHVIRLNLDRPGELEDIEFSKRAEDRVHRIHLDPTGNHLLLSLASEEVLYLHSKWKKPRPLPKMKGMLIESVAWDGQNTSQATTRQILIGTSQGRIYETCIEASPDRGVVSSLVGGREQVMKLLYAMECVPVTGLRFEKFPADPNNKLLIMATTPTRIYEFVSGPTFDAVFARYETNPPFHELPGDLGRSELHVYHQYQGLPTSFAWLTSPGIYHGGLTFGSQTEGVLTDNQLFPYLAGAPISMCLTEFHFLLLYPDRLQVICKLNEQVVFDQLFPPQAGKLRGISKDPLTSHIFCYSESCIFEVYVDREDRNVWELYLNMRQPQFDMALQYCKDPMQRDRVWSCQADYYFKQGSYDLAAQHYGQTQRSFEEITLKFINLNQRDALKTYLLRKLSNMNPQRDAMQGTIVCSWLTEIFLNKLNQLKEKEQVEAATGTEQTRKKASLAIELEQEEFRDFMKSNKKLAPDRDGKRRDWLDTQITFNLIASHGRIEELLFFASLIEDFERVISHWIQLEQYQQALLVMSKQNNADVFYKFSPTLMHHLPERTVNSWLQAAPFLDPVRLIPALMRYQPRPNAPNQAIRYLQRVVSAKPSDFPHLSDRGVIMNYLLSLHALSDDESALLEFLNTRENIQQVDLKYALRLCTKEGRTRACVLIYSAMHLYEEAVDLALKKGDLELAKRNAMEPEDDAELRKKLWLRIASHVVQEEHNIKKAMEFVKESQLLKIEDILPFFPHFLLIDQFKEEICSSLQDYNKHIDELKAEMLESTESADLIRRDIKDLRNRCGFVAGDQKCDICDYPLLSRQFYLFPCQHSFHADCLTSEMVQHLTIGQKQRVEELNKAIEREMRTRNARGINVRGADESVVVSAIEKLRIELNDIVASECIFCGDIMINTIDLPFVKPTETDAIRSWYL